MTYLELIKLLPSASHLYYDVSVAEVKALTVSKWLTRVGAKTCIGTEDPVSELVAKELVPTDEDLATLQAEKDALIEAQSAENLS